MPTSVIYGFICALFNGCLFLDLKISKLYFLHNFAYFKKITQSESESTFTPLLSMKYNLLCACSVMNMSKCTDRFT